MRLTISVLLLLCLTHCQSRPMSIHAAAAEVLKERYDESPLSRWKMRVHAAGRDCDVLLVETDHVLDVGIIEAMHYGGDSLRIYRGGIHDFYRQRTFRGVVYRDFTLRAWPYGEVHQGEAESMRPCD
jgi:hypothetical protein